MTDDKDISEARFIKPDGTVKIVQAGGELRPGNVRYDRHTHEGHLKCLCCDAASRLKSGGASRGGSSAPNTTPPHFAVARHKKDCVDYLRHSTPSTQKVDRTRGYRLHLNMSAFSDVFNDRSGVYDISQGGRITINDPDLQGRESFAVNDMKELVAFMNWADPKRLADTVPIFRNKKLDWGQFFVDMSDPAAAASLADRAKARKKGEAPPFALLKIETTRSYVGHRWGKVEPLPLDPFDGGATKARRPRDVYLQIWLDKQDMPGVTWGFHGKGEYYVLGTVRHGLEKENGPRKRDWVNVSIQDPRQIQATKFIENAPARGAKPAPSGP
jgi:hypothetical protein